MVFVMDRTDEELYNSTDNYNDYNYDPATLLDIERYIAKASERSEWKC